jgi:DNA-binding XRE family transcriptional regulator
MEDGKMVSNGKLYLRDDVYIEPLFNGWYAWSYLVPPVHASRCVVNTHRRIMKSFVNNYELHISAVKGAVVTERVPSELRGFVELVLDLQHPDIPTHRAASVSKQVLQAGPAAIFVRLIGESGRASLRFEHASAAGRQSPQGEPEFHLLVGRWIFQSRETPLEVRRVTEVFEDVETTGALHYRELFTERRSKYERTQMNGGVRLEYMCHAGFLVQSKNCAVLVDPVIASRGEGYADEVFGFSQLPPQIDFICLTHNHQDHVNLETLLQLRYKTDQVDFKRDLLCNSNDSSCKAHMSLYNRISVFRAERGMSRRELAEALEVNHQTIGYLERGDYKPSLELAMKIARHFGVAVEMVFSLDRFPMTFGRKGEGG